MGQLGIRIVNVALFTVCCFQIASVFNDVSAGYLRPGPGSFAAVAPGAAPAARAWDERQPILDRNLFGAETFAAEPLSEPEPEELEVTTLPVTLLGTQVHSVRKNSKAAILGRGSRQHELLHEGDTFEKHPEARIIRIERGRVILRNEGRREELLLAAACAADTRSTPAPDRSARRRSRRPSKSTPAATSASLTERLRDLQKSKSRSEPSDGRDLASILRQGRLVPQFAEGSSQMVGMELRDIEPGSIYEKVGLNEGDIITSVNGIVLDNAGAVSKVLPELASAEQLEIETTSGPITVTQEELSELLESGKYEE
jgi:general secretion pathway protein C